jgi:hypothetical protein
MDETEILKTRIARGLRDYYPTVREARLVSSEGPKYYQNSTTYCFSFDGLKARILVKVIKGTIGEAHLQYEALQRLWPLFAAKGVNLCVPRPLALFNDMNAIVMESVPGLDLMRLVHRTRWPVRNLTVRSSLISASNAAGAWLSYFHELGRFKQVQEVKTEQILEQVKGEIELCVRAQFPADFADVIYKFVRSGLEEIVPSAEVLSHVHGDFKLDNIVAGDNVLAVVDILPVYYNVIFYDIASFRNSIDLLRIDPRNALISRAFLESLKDQFLAGYFRNDCRPMKSIRTFQVIGLLSKYLYLRNRICCGKFVYLRFFIKRIQCLMRNDVRTHCVGGL